MAGDERVRHCTLCDLNVYNFGEMTRDEIRELITRTEGRLCARMYRRADGTLLTKDCPTGLQRLQRRMSRAKTAVTAALFGAAAFLTGCSSSRPRQSNPAPNVKLNVERAAVPRTSSFSGTIRDAAGKPLPGVSVLLCDEAGQHEITAITDEHGVFAVPFPADGAYHVEVNLAGFAPVVIDHLVLKQSETATAQVSMDGVIATVGVVVSARQSAVTADILSTTFPQEFIDKLPN